jgi:hypothetical protein
LLYDRIKILFIILLTASGSVILHGQQPDTTVVADTIDAPVPPVFHPDSIENNPPSLTYSDTLSDLLLNSALSDTSLVDSLQVVTTGGSDVEAQVDYNAGDYFRARAFLERYLGLVKANPGSLWLGVRIEEKMGNQSAMLNYANTLKGQYPDSEQTRELLEWENERRTR